jgi:hypothetical protein
VVCLAPRAPGNCAPSAPWVGASVRPLNFPVSRHRGSSAVIQASFRGGAQVGWVSASWPFAKLSAEAGTLTLSCLGTYTFAPAEVVALQPYGSIPILARGIRIQHNRRDYPRKIIFWCMGGRDSALAEIAETGFSARGQPLDRATGFPVRWSAILILLVVWNGLFLLDREEAGSRTTPGPLALVALILLFATATAAQISPRFQRSLLRDGHELGEIKSIVTLIQLVSGLMVVAFTITLFVQK